MCFRSVNLKHNDDLRGSDCSPIFCPYFLNVLFSLVCWLGFLTMIFSLVISKRLRKYVLRLD